MSKPLRLFIFILIVIILFGSAIYFLIIRRLSSDDSGVKYRKVTVTGDISTAFDETQLTTEGLVILTTKGKYEINLWFAEKGGEPVKQDNKVWLTDLESPHYGTAYPCKILSTDSTAKDLHSFQVKAVLTPEGYKPLDTGGKVIGVLDSLDFSVRELPDFPFNYTSQCQGAPATLSDFGSSYRQLLLAFQEQHNINIAVGESSSSSFHPFNSVANIIYSGSHLATEELVNTLD